MEGESRELDATLPSSSSSSSAMVSKARTSSGSTRPDESLPCDCGRADLDLTPERDADLEAAPVEPGAG